MMSDTTIGLLTSCRRIFLRNFEVHASIGAHEFEKETVQRVVVNVDLYVPLELSTPKLDELGEVVDYDYIRAAVRECLTSGHIELQETLCDAILARILANPNVRAARVSTEKPDVYPDCEAVGVEVFKFK